MKYYFCDIDNLLIDYFDDKIHTKLKDFDVLAINTSIDQLLSYNALKNICFVLPTYSNNKIKDSEYTTKLFNLFPTLNNEVYNEISHTIKIGSSAIVDIPLTNHFLLLCPIKDSKKDYKDTNSYWAMQSIMILLTKFNHYNSNIIDCVIFPGLRSTTSSFDNKKIIENMIEGMVKYDCNNDLHIDISNIHIPKKLRDIPPPTSASNQKKEVSIKLRLPPPNFDGNDDFHNILFITNDDN